MNDLPLQGAERQVRVPGELERFAELAMKVESRLEDDKVGHWRDVAPAGLGLHAVNVPPFRVLPLECRCRPGC